jgi:predicted transcriptional regulator of viral defense system
VALEASNDVGIDSPSLGPREVRLLAEWERERRNSVTLTDIQNRVGKPAAKYVARELVRKGALRRIRRGAYLVRPLRTLLWPSVPSTAVATAALLQSEPYYLGGLWAVSFHRFSTQRYANIVDAFVTHRLAPRPLGPGKVRFHALSRRLVDYGVTSAEIEGVPVRLSDPERTLLDALDRPRLFGGLGSALSLLAENLSRLDQQRLVSYAVGGSKPTTRQRLGVVLERAGASARVLAPLQPRALKPGSLLSMAPDKRRKGTINRRWGVVENDL